MESIQIELIKDEGSKILFLKWLKDKSDEILKNHISEEDLVCFLREFFDFANGPKPSEIDEDNWENMWENDWSTVDFTKIKFGFQKDKPQQTTFSLLSQAFGQKDDIISCCSAPHFEFQTKFGEELVNSTANNNLKQQTVNDDENNNKQNKNNEEESSGSHDTDSNSAEYSDFSSQSD